MNKDIKDEKPEDPEDEGTLRLSPRETEVFVEALRNPPEPSERAKEVARRYLRMTGKA